MNVRIRAWPFALFVASFLLLAACSSKDEAQSPTPPPYTGATIKGVVKGEPAAPAAAAGVYTLLSGRNYRPLATETLAGCTVTVRDIDSGAVIATATTDANGQYIIDGLVDGTNYEVIATCGAKTFSSFAAADTVSPTSPAKAVDTVDAQSTLIAAYISKSIKDAVAAALAGITDPTLRQIIKQAIFGAIDEVMAQVQEEIRTALDSGQLVIDDALATQLAQAQETAAGVDAPLDPDAIMVGQDTTVINAAADASAAFLALRTACDTAVNPGTTLKDCIKQLAKTMYGLKQPIYLVLDNPTNTPPVYGTFDAEGLTYAARATICNATWAAANGFSEAKTTLIDDTTGPGGTGTTGLFACTIEPLVKAFNRNDPSGQYHGGDDGGLMWHDYQNGMLRAIAASLLNGQRYNVSALDQLVVGYAAVGGGEYAGLNMRYFADDRRGATYYYNSGAGKWISFPYRDPACPECGTLSENDLQGALTATWAEDITDTNPANGVYDYLERWGDPAMRTTVQTLVQAIAASYSVGNPPGFDTTLATWFKGGNGATKAQVTDSFNNDRMHIENNPSGPREYRVLYEEQPDYRDVYDAATGVSTRSPCDDNDPATPCLSIGGTSEPVVRAGATRDASGAIATITISDVGVGELMFEPVWTRTGASTALRVLSEVQQADLSWRVKYLRNSYGAPLIVYAVTQTDVAGPSTVCELAPTNPWDGPSGIPGSCTEGQFYQVSEYWIQAGGDWDVQFVRVSDTPVAVTTPGPITGLMTEQWQQVNANIAGRDEWGLLGYWTNTGNTALRFNLSDLGGGTPGLTEDAATGAWYIKVFEQCDAFGCAPYGFGFLDAATGALLDDSDVTLGAIGIDSFNPANAAILASTVNCTEIQNTIDRLTGPPAGLATANASVLVDLQAILDGLTTNTKCAATGATVQWWELPGLFFAATNVQVSYDGTTIVPETQWLPNPTVRMVNWAQISGAAIFSRGATETLLDVVHRWDIFNGPYANKSWKADQAPAYLDDDSNGVRDVGELVFDFDYEIEWRLLDQYFRACDWGSPPAGGCDQWGRDMAAADMAKVKFQDNGWVYGNNVVATKLLNAAFDFSGGTLVVTDTSRHDALQLFAALFLHFEGEGGQRVTLTVNDPDGLNPVSKGLSVYPTLLADIGDFNPPFANGICQFSVTPATCPYPYVAP